MASSRRATAGGRGPFPETYGQWWTILEALPREALFEVASTFCAGLISLSRTTEQMEQQNVAIREEFQRTAGGPDAPSSALLQRPVSATPILRGVETILEHAAERNRGVCKAVLKQVKITRLLHDVGQCHNACRPAHGLEHGRSLTCEFCSMYVLDVCVENERSNGLLKLLSEPSGLMSVVLPHQ